MPGSVSTRGLIQNFRRASPPLSYAESPPLPPGVVIYWVVFLLVVIFMQKFRYFYLTKWIVPNPFSGNSLYYSRHFTGYRRHVPNLVKLWAFFTVMKNLLGELSQSEIEKYFKWIIISVTNENCSLFTEKTTKSRRENEPKNPPRKEQVKEK